MTREVEIHWLRWIDSFDGSPILYIREPDKGKIYTTPVKEGQRFLKPSNTFFQLSYSNNYEYDSILFICQLITGKYHQLLILTVCDAFHV